MERLPGVACHARLRPRGSKHRALDTLAHQLQSLLEVVASNGQPLARFVPTTVLQAPSAHPHTP